LNGYRSTTNESIALELSTDRAWEEWGKRDPYFSVITDPRYRRTALDEGARREFFATGRGHVDYLLSTIRKNVDPDFTPRSVVDFGCGVGRLLIPFASVASDVVGLDVSDAMLQEAQRNCELHKAGNVRLIKSDDGLSGLTGVFDLLHSCIVFQHIPFARGQVILAQLLQHIRPGGVAAIQVLYSNANTHANANAATTTQVSAAPDNSPADQPPQVDATSTPAADPDPELQMNPYDMNRVFLILHRAGIRKFFADFTDHGGELGIFLFFQAPAT